VAEIVLGIGCAHTPQLHTLAKDWDIRAARDRLDGVPMWWKGRKVSYAELAALRADENIAAELDLPTRQAALDASFAAIERLHAAYVAADPDVVIIVGNDQHEIFSDMVPTFAVIAAEEIGNLPRTDAQKARLPVGIEISDHGHLPEAQTVYPGHRPLGLHLGRSLTQSGFDVTLCHDKPTVRGDKSLLHGMPHAYGFLYKNIMRDHVRPHVPIDVNCWYYDNSPTAARCYDFGAALADAVAAWDSDARVAILTTGGLTHFVVDPQWDARFLQAMRTDDAATLRGLPQNELMAGTSECKSWIATSAAMARSGLAMEVVDYQRLYRTEGGTGSSCGFVAWHKP
jgi:hypothetical protein